MALRYAILAALTERASTGIQLARRFDRSFGYFWSATHQQIYREIARLTAAGLVTSHPGAIGRGRPRELTITPEGEAALREWTAEINDPSAPREAIMVKVRAAATAGDAAALRPLIEHHLRVHEQTLARYREIEEAEFDGTEDPRTRLRHLILHGGLLIEAAWVKWCHDAIDTLGLLEAETSRPEGGEPLNG